MSSFDFASPSGIWGPEMVPGAGHYRRWDVTQSKMLNGTDGGVYAPSSRIVVGGAGMVLENSTMTGGVKTTSGGRIWIRFVDVPRLSSRAIVRTMSLLTVPPVAVGGTFARGTTLKGGVPVSFPVDSYLPIVQPGPAPAGLAPLFTSSLTFGIPSHYLISGQQGATNAQLASVTLGFRITSRPDRTPVIPMSVTAWTTQPRQPSTQAPRNIQLLTELGLYSGWRPNFPFPQGNYVVPLNKSDSLPSLSYFRNLSISGNSGIQEPTWNTTPGAVTLDGALSWKCIGQVGQMLFGSPDFYFNGGASQSLRADFDTDASEAIDLSKGGLSVQVNNLPSDGSFVLHAVQLNFTNITAWTWL